jgi:predicted Zn-dependent protease
MEEGRAALAGGDAERAREAFDRAREAVPGEASGHLRAAEVRIALRRPLEAIEVLRDVRPGTPGVAALVFRASTALLEGGETEKALWALEGALGADPKGVEALLDAEPAWAARREGAEVRAILSRIGTAGDGRVDRPGASDTVPHDAGTSAYDASKTN